MTLNLDGRLSNISKDSPPLFSARVECAAVRNNLRYPEGTPQFKRGLEDLKFFETACTLPDKLKSAAFDFAFKQSVGSILVIGDYGLLAKPLLPALRDQYLRTGRGKRKNALIAAITQIDPATTTELLQNADTRTLCDSIGAACGFAKRRNRHAVIDALLTCPNSKIRAMVKHWQSAIGVNPKESADISLPTALAAVGGTLSRLSYRAACMPLIRKHIVNRYHKVLLKYKLFIFEASGLNIPEFLKQV